MICWNEFGIESLNKYFQKLFDWEKPNGSFVVLVWDENVWKTSVLLENINKLLWDYAKTDLLHIKDLSTIIWKKHTIKIEVWEKDKYIKTDDWVFLDYWTRDIISWLSLSPIWKYKVVLLEKIERMWVQAANAFLKTFEESYDNVLIFATCSNKELLLDTIVSRAFLINFQVPPFETVKLFLLKKYPNLNEKLLDNIISFSLWKIGLAIKIIDDINANSDSESAKILNYFDEYIKLDSKDWNYGDKLNLFTQIEKLWYLDSFLASLIYKYSQDKKFNKIEKLVQLNKHIGSNVKLDNALLNMII